MTENLKDHKDRTPLVRFVVDLLRTCCTAFD